jgi:O-antigen ligase
VNPDADPVAAPWSLSPFLTLRSMWLWFAYLALFVFTVHLAEDPVKVERLTMLLLVAGVAFGLFGIGQWLAGLRELFGTDPSSAGLRATATFGNRNHYAAFMGMLLLCSLGWMGSRWARITRRSLRASRQGPRVAGQEAKAKLTIAGLGIVFLALGLVFSLSRSGISFALVACGAFALLVRPAYEPMQSETIELESSGRGRKRRGKRGPRGHWLWALGLAVLAIAIWIGIDPVVERFELLPKEWEAESGRYQVWADSLSVVEDFWLTGSGLSSFRYVYPIYRSFGGRIFYSWAHNDYLQALIELGVPGFACIVWILIGVSLAANRVRKNLDGDPSSLHLHAGYCAAAVAIALHSFTDFSLHLAADAALLSVVLGVVVGFGKREQGTGRGSKGRFAVRESELS